MDPNAWKKDAAGLFSDLSNLLRDSHRARHTLHFMAFLAEDSRQKAWDQIAVPTLDRAVAKRPSLAKKASGLKRRLRVVLFDGPAASAPPRLRSLLEDTP